MKTEIYFIKSSITGILFFLLMVFSGCNADQPELLTPMEGGVVQTNTPILSWMPVESDSQEVWINGIHMATLGSDVTSYVPFPLSFGVNEWKIVAINGSGKVESPTGSFVVDDEPLFKLPGRSQLLRHNWRVQSALITSDDGETLSTGNAHTADWYQTSIPATALSVLVRNGVYPNPYVGKNNMKIPDSHDGYNQEYDLIKYSHISGENPWAKPYWYVNEFEIDHHLSGTRVWLNFGEINYRGELWFNGHQLTDTSAMVGMERQFRYDITDLLESKGKNRLAVAIYPVDHPGEPGVEPLEPFGDPGVNMGDGIISRNYTKWDAVGWDWQPAIRDRNMGITEDVFISFTDDVEIENLYITSVPNLPEASHADMTISFDLVNHSGSPKEGTVKGEISHNDKSHIFEIPFSLGRNQVKSISLNSHVNAALRIEEPALWWPVGYGEPDLYQVSVSLKTTDDDHFTVKKHHGIRTIETYIGSNSRVFKVNGKEIYCKGGNWVIDMMLNWTTSRYELEILMTKNANLNMLRVWGPTGVPPKAFYYAADKHGILLWQDFLNDYWGTFRNTPGYLPDADLYETITSGIIKRYRNHPSLIIWCGGNEGVNPREDLIVNKLLPMYDGQSGRVYLTESDGDGLHGGGPYHTIRPAEYFSHERMHGFSSEIGPSGVPVLESIMRFMPEIGQVWKPGFFPIDGTWAYHDAANFPGEDLRKFTAYDDIVRLDYGGPRTKDENGIQEYFYIAQMVNYDVYRAAIESINRQLWENSTGMLLWKSNASWPSMVWQLYDWYLQSHAGYYGAKKAFAPLGIQLNRDNMTISVINSQYKKNRGTNVSAILYNEEMEVIWGYNEEIGIPKNGVKTIDTSVPLLDELNFLKLSITTVDGSVIADNFYWLHNENDFTGMMNIGEPILEVTANRKSEDKFIVTVENIGKVPSILTRIQLVNPVSNHEILPAFWCDNFISLLPGEKRSLSVKSISELSQSYSILIDAYNMSKTMKINP
ncbi:glycoside hydrolase family 2 protein [Natronoflexus pectinivorans]|uniref:Beta-galactosidase/beta-glucuronidase n=1 Tax=Natronoflexus pectinivorans TaxID=682526 RepID=A0A4R2GJE0_9BACT|nr:hypothetical protein [Natronoflexus pectinivorans]TCO08433.1 beta-galactosidase/beta-glucuronidase [Natronoflexus pectinivorans]